MSKKKKAKKDKDKKDQDKKKAKGNRLSKLGSNVASLGTALAGAVVGEGAQATIAKVVEKGTASDQLDTMRHTLKEAAGAVKNAASAIQAALEDADAGVTDAATSLNTQAEDAQASVGTVIGGAVKTLNDFTDQATSSVKRKKDKGR